jgi:hypothetical protein
MQPEDQIAINTDTSIENAAHLLQWTFPNLPSHSAQIHCLASVVGYQLHDNSVTNIIVFHRKGFLCWTICFYGLSIIPLEWIHY